MARSRHGFAPNPKSALNYVVFAGFLLALLAGSLVPVVALAQSQSPASPAPPPATAAPAPSSEPAAAYGSLPTVTVVGTTPLPGTGIDINKVPANVQSLTSGDLERQGAPSLLNSMTNQLGSVSVNNNLDDPYQPNIAFRGFQASPVLGTPQGLAVYQDGVRINEAFGDTVNWDLIPPNAIDSVNVVSSNPVYGLNALGGAVLLTMKNGFTYHGFEGDAAGGSWNQRNGSLQYGQQVGPYAAYLAGNYYASEGWRQFSPDTLQQLYGSAGAHGENLSLDLNFTGANNRLNGEGATPEQELAAGRSLVFTNPQNNFDELEFVTANAAYQATDTLSFQGNGYRREFHQTVLNGNTTNYTSCGNGFLCQSDGTTPLVGPNGAPIPDISDGGTLPIGELDSETIHAVGTGGSLQTTDTAPLFGHDNNFVFGGSLDHDVVDFQSGSEVGVINSALQVGYSGFFVDTPENSGFNATPVSLTAVDNYYGIFVTDTFNVTPALAVTASGRYNLAFVDLADHLGSNLTGNNRYSRFNPAFGFTDKLLSNLTFYAGYSEGNRVPTPSEIECSNPAQPCLLPSSLSSDPPTLKQVVSHTYEAGLRGNFAAPTPLPGKFTWNFDLFRTDLTDDIYGVATSISSGFFENIGSTRRQGIESKLAYRDDHWSAYLAYSLVDATFQSPLTLPSPNNPAANAAGNIQVQPGDHLPGIPQHQLKLGADYQVTPQWSVGGTLAYFSSQYLTGDESNQTSQLPGYAVVGLHSTYEVTRHAAMFVAVDNLFDSHYSTYGLYGDPTGVGAPGIPAGATTNGPGVDNRFVSPGAPLSVFGGIRVTF
jgi:iron complex outermembrane recepter protein